MMTLESPRGALPLHRVASGAMAGWHVVAWTGALTKITRREERGVDTGYARGWGKRAVWGVPNGRGVCQRSLSDERSLWDLWSAYYLW